MTETNLVIFELNPYSTRIYRIPDNIVSAAELATISGLRFNVSDCSEESGDIFNKLSEYINSIEALKLPVTPDAYEQIYYVIYML